MCNCAMLLSMIVFALQRTYVYMYVNSQIDVDRLAQYIALFLYSAHLSTHSYPGYLFLFAYAVF